MLPTESQRKKAGQRLVDLVQANRYHINTGFVGTPLICDALCNIGEYETAYRLLNQRECPSWLYPVTMGATTIWERWDSLLPDGTVNPGEMTSFNHYALGAVADWLHRTVGGLAPAGPGYRQLEIQPKPGGGLTHACSRHQTPYGMAMCSWKIEARIITVNVEVPPNTTAVVILPEKNGEPIKVGSGKYQWAYPYIYKTKLRFSPSLDTTFGELIDDPEIHALVMKILNQYNPEFVTRVDGQDSVTLREAVSKMPHSVKLLTELESALSAISRKGKSM
jgi:alpha-L-rhamnosidase